MYAAESQRHFEGAFQTGATIAFSAGRRHLIVARFEAYLDANPTTRLSLPEICDAIDVAERTLRRACEDLLGMSPIRYLSFRRMHLVRRALLRAMPSTVTVTKIACDYGFCELGRFSNAYRALFGESPSATLKRPPNAWPLGANRAGSRDGLSHSCP